MHAVACSWFCGQLLRRFVVGLGFRIFLLGKSSCGGQCFWLWLIGTMHCHSSFHTLHLGNLAGDFDWDSCSEWIRRPQNPMVGLGLGGSSEKDLCIL